MVRRRPRMSVRARARARKNIPEEYITPGHVVAFSAPANIKRSSHPNLQKEEIAKVLQSVDAYTLHREYKKPRTRNPFYLNRKRQQIQLDLIDVSHLKRYNFFNGKQVTFLLAAIDGFTKVRRKERN